jgi:NADH-quinone oxidoreductase subunit L
MIWIVQNLWLIPALPILAAGIAALLKQRSRIAAASLAIGSMALSFLLSLCAFAHVLLHPSAEPLVRNIPWFQFGNEWLKIGWMLDPLTAVMLVMVTFVGLLIFIYSTGYMEHDENFTRFFCFLALFAGAMLGVVIANSLLLLFMYWEIVGLTSYLLIGFWYFTPSAAAAAKKAFITTRIGDLGFLIGMVWLYAQSHTLLFYDAGAGCLEQSSLAHLVATTTVLGITASAAIGILIFCGAAGKSGQVPLHVWLPDAMEGPTPVSALIHAATMVAAGVFLIARIYPLMAAGGTTAIALQVVTWVGAITALCSTSSPTPSSKPSSSSAPAPSFMAARASRTSAAWAACASTCPSPSPSTPSACWRSAASHSSSPVSGRRTPSSTPPTTGASPNSRSTWAHSARSSPPST